MSDPSPGPEPAPVVFDIEAGRTRWSVGYKLRRGLWAVARALLFRPTPKRLGNRWRVALLRCFGATIDGWPLILPSVRILQPWQLRIGRGGMIGAHAELYNYALITIGADTVISQDCCLCTGSHDHTDPTFPLIWSPITIGSGCWLAARSFVMPGVSIGDGTVIGACSVVTRAVAGWSIAAGNPCKVLRPRIMAKGAPAAAAPRSTPGAPAGQ
jgi:putative colanic acid biosynthesis acetyltransferase WcaF